MFKKWKKIIAAVLSSAMILTCSGCTIGKNTAYALTVDGYQVKAGVYIYYSYSALNEAKNEAKKQDENLDTDDKKALEKVTLDGKSFLDYVKKKTEESCVNHVAVIRHFNELNLSLTEEQEDQISEYVDATWESNGKMFEENGIGKDSMREIMASSYKSDEIFNAYYGENGSENITDSQLKNYYIENNARVRYIGMDLHDSEGNELDAAGKKEIKDMADDFLKRAKNAANEEKMLEEFNAFQEEYDKYVSDKAAEASGEDEDSSDEATTTAATTTTVTTTTTVLTTESDNDNEDEENSDSAETTAPEDEDSEETTTTTTTAPEDEDSEEETTTTTSIHGNENIIHVVTTKADTKEEDIYYNPSKKAYEWIFNNAKVGTPEIVEDDETLYVIVKFDIKDRVTEDDLWNESNIESVRYEMFSEDMQDKLKEIGNQYIIAPNEKAYKKYDPFDIKFE